MKTLRSFALVVPFALALASAGCADKKVAAPAKSPATLAHGASGQGGQDPNLAGARQGNGDAAVDTNGLHVSDAIARACALPQTKVAPSFEFDSAQIAEDDRGVLSAIARCLSEGALRGKSLDLVGRADPRGEGEYNMSLGESRADSVRRYLHDLGVQQERLRATSRGELDASGTDETSWARDRRVDIELASK